MTTECVQTVQQHCLKCLCLDTHRTCDYIWLIVHYRVLFNSWIRVRVMVTIRFSVSLISGYAHVFVRLSVVIVTLPLYRQTCIQRDTCCSAWRRISERLLNGNLRPRVATFWRWNRSALWVETHSERPEADVRMRADRQRGAADYFRLRRSLVVRVKRDA